MACASGTEVSLEASKGCRRGFHCENSSRSIFFQTLQREEPNICSCINNYWSTAKGDLNPVLKVGSAGEYLLKEKFGFLAVQVLKGQAEDGVRHQLGRGRHILGMARGCADRECERPHRPWRGSALREDITLAPLTQNILTFITLHSSSNPVRLKYGLKMYSCVAIALSSLYAILLPLGSLGLVLARLYNTHYSYFTVDLSEGESSEEGEAAGAEGEETGEQESGGGRRKRERGRRGTGNQREVRQRAGGIL